MAIEIIVRKLHHSLVPVDQTNLELFESLKGNSEYKVTISTPRNLGFHKLFFAFVAETFNMQEHFEDQETYRKWLVMKAGYFTTIVCPNGNTIFAPESISFSKLDQEGFEALYSKVIDVFLKELGGDMTQDELMRVLNYA